MNITKTEALLSFKNEITKRHIEFDMSGRISKIYEAFTDADDGELVIVREFIYHGTSSIVKGRKEGYSQWNSAWDVVTVPDYLTDDLSNRLTDDTGNYLTEN